MNISGNSTEKYDVVVVAGMDRIDSQIQNPIFRKLVLSLKRQRAYDKLRRKNEL